jgi:hypothetical protein
MRGAKRGSGLLGVGKEIAKTGGSKVKRDLSPFTISLSPS